MVRSMADEKNYGDAVEPIAIVGMSCRYPGEAKSVDDLWEMIVNARTGHSEVPPSRWNAAAHYHPYTERRGTVNAKGGFFLSDDISKFDASFFSITAKEVAAMDPLQRLLLEVGYEAFENAGVPMTDLPGSPTSVYSGCMTNDYELLSTNDTNFLGHNAASGNGRTMLANRLSWFFDLRGPSLMLDTACSSSLYALHLACQSVRLGESKMSLVTGSNLILHPNMMSRLSDMHMLSPEGISHSFDDRANGYGRGEAIGCLVVKPLKDALADGNTIRAVIRGSGANQDGHTPGITMPNGSAQADLLRHDYKMAGLEFKDTGYFEAHGTGTGLGDPTELGAIGNTLGVERHSDQAPLYVGSIKTNIGHTEGAAGVAGVIKAVLTLEKGVIPPNSGLENMNPKINLHDGKLALPAVATPWPTSGVRRASVFSFGFGGSNAHAIIDDAQHYLALRGLSGKTNTIIHDESASDSGFSSRSATPPLDGPPPSKKKVFVFSNHDQAGLKRTAQSYSDHISKRLDLPRETDLAKSEAELLRDISYTLAEHRTLFDFRSFAVASSLKELQSTLSKGLPKLKRVSKHDNIIGIFTGQGAQWATMGTQLMENPIFAASIHETQKFFESFGCEWNLIEEMLKPKDTSRIDNPMFSQPVCTALQVALVDTLKYWGVGFKAVAGHSSGEIGAAYAAGYLSHEDAVKIAYWRGVYSAQVNQRLNGRRGIMMAAGVSEDEAKVYLQQVPENSAVVACVNSPSSVTLSGDVESIDILESLLRADNKFARKLRVETAYHSPHMKVVSEDYHNSMATVKPLKASSDTVMYSSVHGKLASAEELDATYWVANLLQTVRFSDAVQGILSHSKASRGRRKAAVNWTAIVEVGPHEALKGPLNQIMAKVDSKLSTKVTYTSVVSRGKSAVDTALEAVATLWCEGHSIDLTKINYDEVNRKDLMIVSDLPAYAWNHEKSFWHEATSMTEFRNRTQARTDLLGAPVDNQNKMEPRWSNYLRLPENPWMADHEITSTILYPGAGMIIMAIEAAMQRADPSKTVKGFELRSLSFDRGLVIPAADQTVETSLTLLPLPALPGWYNFTVFSLPPGGSWTKHSWGMISLVYDGEQTIADDTSYAQTFEGIKKASTKAMSVSDFYSDLKELGMGYGPLFTNMIDAATPEGQNCGYGTIIVPDTKASMPEQFEFPHIIHPATLDAIFHLLFVAFSESGWMKEAAVPVGIKKMYISANQPQGAGAKFSGYAKTTSLEDLEAVADLVVSDESWSEPKIAIEEFAVKKVSSSASAKAGTNEIQKCGVLTWSEDVEYLRGEAGEAFIKSKGHATDSIEQLLVWLERACFKDASLRVLIVGEGLSVDGLQLIKHYAPKAGKRFGFGQCTIAVESEDAAEAIQKSIADDDLKVEYKVIGSSVEEEKSLKDSTFDLFVAIPEAGKQDALLTALKEIKTHTADFARLAIAARDAQTATSLAEEIGFKKTLISCQSEEGSFSVRTTDHIAETAIKSEEIVLIERQTPSQAAAALSRGLTAALTKAGHRVVSKTLAEAAELKGVTAISLLECNEPLVISWSESEFESFKKLVGQATYIMWLTRGGQMVNSSALEYGASVGLLRTVRTEVMQITLPHLDITPETDITKDETSELIVSLFNSSTKKSEEANEMEYVADSGLVFIPRVKEQSSFDRELEVYSGIVKPVPSPLYQSGRPLRAAKDETSSAKLSLHWVEDNEIEQPMEAHDVEVRTTSLSLQGTDSLLDMLKAGSASISHAAVGVVTKLGSEVRRFRVGETVALLSRNNLKTHLRQHEDLVQAIPATIDAAVAASLPAPYMEAVYALINTANVQHGETILIQDAASGVGPALVQLAQFLGAEVSVTAGSQADKDFLTKVSGIPETKILSSASRAILYPAMEITNGNGYDVVVGTSGGEQLLQCYTCLAEYGKFINLAKNVNPNELDQSMFTRNSTFSTIDMARLSASRPAVVSKLFSKVVDLATAGSIGKGMATNVSSISELSTVLASKTDIAYPITFTMDADAIVPTLPQKAPELELKPEATYVISGGLGALGLTLADMMVTHGAKHLIFLSRSGLRNMDQHNAMDSLRSRGCNAEVAKCDVNSDKAVKDFALDCVSKGYQVKGVIQCAMVLRDSVFERMTYEQWVGATTPKIAGSWSLHEHLPKDMDFFVLLSSIVSIIGNVAQANYAAGNSYEDALAHYRHQQGLAATSLNVGLVSDAAHFTAEYTIDDYLAKFGHMGGVLITEDQLNIVLKASMAGKTADGAAVPPQLIAGIDNTLQRDGKSANPWTMDRKFDHRIEEVLDSEAAAKKNVIRDGLTSAKSVRDAGAVVETALRDLVADAMTAKPEDIDVEKPLQTFGIDSLKAVEVRGWIFREIAADVSVFDILSSMPLTELAVRIAAKSALLPSGIAKDGE